MAGHGGGVYFNITSEYTPPWWRVLYVRNITIPIGSGDAEKTTKKY